LIAIRAGAVKFVEALKARFRRKYGQARESLRNAFRSSWQLRQLKPSIGYLLATESHVYAFSIAANALLSFFPFALILLSLCEAWLHWTGAYNAILELIRANLPSGSQFVINGLSVLLVRQRRIEIPTVILMFYASSGVFFPLEVAFNKMWGIYRNRTLVFNLLLSFFLAIFTGGFALIFAAAAGGILKAVEFLFGWLPWHFAVVLFSRIALEVIIVIPLMIIMYFIVYFVLPNGKVRPGQVIPGAVLAAIATEIVKLVYFLILPLLKFPATYGPFSVPVELLFWAYITALVVLWGASFSAQGVNPGAVAPGPAETPTGE
jgi:YihY family inner membrane protein